MKERNRKTRKATEIFVNDSVQISRKCVLNIQLPKLTWELCRYASALSNMGGGSHYIVQAIHEKMRRDGFLTERKGILKVEPEHQENAQSYFDGPTNRLKEA